MIIAIDVYYKEEVANYNQADYFKIPENGKLFLDVIISNVNHVNASHARNTSVGLLYKEVLKNEKIVFEPYAVETGRLNQFYAHKTYNCLDKSDLESLQQDSKLWKIINQK